MDIDVTDLNNSQNLTRIDNIRTSVKNIIYHNKQSVAFDDPDYGAGLRNFIGKALDIYTITLMKRTIENNIKIYETRVKDVRVKVKTNEDYGSIIIEVYFVDKTTEETNTLVLNYKV